MKYVLATYMTRLLIPRCEFGGAILHHQRTTAYSIFQISISRNTKCGNKVGFRKSGHNYGIADYSKQKDGGKLLTMNITG